MTREQRNRRPAKRRGKIGADQNFFDFGVKSENLDVDAVTNSLGIPPTLFAKPFNLARKAGDKRPFLPTNRSWGVWHFCTSEFVSSPNLNEHAEFLIQKLEPVKPAIDAMLADPSYSLWISVLCTESQRFELEAKHLRFLSQLVHSFFFRASPSLEKRFNA